MKSNTISLLLIVLISFLSSSCKVSQKTKEVNPSPPLSKIPVKNSTEARNDTILNPSFNKVEELINSSIEDSAFPGAVLLVWKHGKIIFEKPYGNFTYSDSSEKTATNTIFDLASLTKVIATTTAAIICTDRNLFKIEDKVAKYIPQFAQNGKEDVTIKNLLLHNSGLPAYKKYYLLYSNSKDVLNDIYSTKLLYPAGSKTVYSDLGMITLGKVIEKVTGKKLDVFCNNEIFNPLKMNDTYFNPPDSLKFRIAPTEFDNYWRHRLLIGEVHDETSSLLNGVAGNAGLFSTAGDISKLLQMLLQKGTFEGKRIIDSSTVRLFTSKQYNGRALGWDIKSNTGSSAGNLFSNESYGHTGFTGTSVWIDPSRNLFVVFLTNRVYPTRENNKIIKIRPKLHDLIIRATEK
jgi:CubicO group peptidase (beta-lactamase class C family)